MTPKEIKGKGVASSSHRSKRTRRANEEEHGDGSLPQQPLRSYGLRCIMEKEDKKWFKEHKESKYSHDLFVDGRILAYVFPYMVDRLHTLGLDFVFNASVPVHVTHVTRERVFLVYALMTEMQINVGVIIKNTLRRERGKKVQSFGFGDLLTRFMRGHEIKEEEVDYIPVYDPRGIDVTKTKEPQGVNGPVLSFNECNVRINKILSHLYGM
ncbi:hypothetical protein HAX54_042259 [Datura stramonium]|uniref:Uncharacterized protein n=1 Tax=Datura stramonium TaxID=4076 RepID=A0ABS8SMD4_DATST|nr:hypothetical protein [Datura stramonium]